MALLMLEEGHRLRPGPVDARGRGVWVKPGCEGKAQGCQHWWDAAPPHSPSPSFSRGLRATSAVTAQSLAAVPHSSQQCYGAGSGQDTVKGQRGASGEAADQGCWSKPPASLNHAPAPSTAFPHSFRMKLLPLDWHRQKGSHGLCLASLVSPSYCHLSAWHEREHSGLVGLSLAAICTFTSIFHWLGPSPWT